MNQIGIKPRGTITRFNVQRTMMNQYFIKMNFWLMNKLKRPSSIKHRCYVENSIERRTIKTVEIDQVNSRFVLLLRWMEIIFAKRRKNACLLAAILIWIYENMKRTRTCS